MAGTTYAAAPRAVPAAAWARGARRSRRARPRRSRRRAGGGVTQAGQQRHVGAVHRRRTRPLAVDAHRPRRHVHGRQPAVVRAARPAPREQQQARQAAAAGPRRSSWRARRPFAPDSEARVLGNGLRVRAVWKKDEKKHD